MKKTILALVLIFVFTSPAHGQWVQWGGPTGDFAVEAPSKLETWGDLGPKVLWLKELGPGYSGIVVNGSRLFTTTRQGEEDVVVALAAKDGAELWRHTYHAPTDNLGYVDKSYGDAPQATPLLADGRVISFGFSGILTAVDAESGKALWSHDLSTEFRTGVPYFGHAASPVRVGDTVVVLAGGAHAFDVQTGALRWKNRDFDASYASPILVDSPTGKQLVAAAAGEVVGLSPEDGRLLWRHEHANRHKTFLSTPAMGADGTLFASAYFLGSIGLRFAADGTPTEQWEIENLQVAQSNVVTLDDMVVASHNRNLMAVDLPSGELLWREPGVGRANLVRLGKRALLLDDRGRLTLAELNRSGLKRLTSARILEGRSWTAPTVIGNRLFARNGSEIVAVDLTVSARSAAETAAGKRNRKGRAAVQAPREFVQAVAQLETAALRADTEALQKALDTLQAYQEDASLAPYVHYHRGFAAWQKSLWAPRDQRLPQVDLAVEELKRAIELEEQFSEAHALLAPLYSSYYRLDRARASVIGQFGDEHLAEAREMDSKNLLVTTIHAFDLLKSPVQYGGDPEQGKALLVEVIQGFDGEAREASDPGPRWGPIMARAWLGEQLLKEGNHQEAKKVLEESLRLAPGFSFAQGLLEKLGK